MDNDPVFPRVDSRVNGANRTTRRRARRHRVSPSITSQSAAPKHKIRNKFLIKLVSNDRERIVLLACLLLFFVSFTLYVFRSSSQNHPPGASYKVEQSKEKLQGQNCSLCTEGVYTEKSNPPGTCILDRSEMPESWKAPESLEFQDSGKQWTKKEQELANAAGQKGLDELVNFYNTISKERIISLSTDAANSLIDECFSSANMPHFHNLACEAAGRVVKIVAEEYVSREDHYRGCKDMHHRAKLLGYANHLSKTLPGDAQLRRTRNILSKRMQASLDACGSLSNYLEVRDWEADLENMRTARATIRHFVHRSNALTDLYTVPELQLPDELDRFTARLWQYVAKYRFTNARDVKHGYHDSNARHMAFLVTHIAYMPTGYGRHRQFVEDAPWLYKYIRENYYAAMEQGDLDLFAEFIDILRQYGCTEDNDLMVRHGSRYLLDMYVKAGHSWMDQNGDSNEELDDYDLIHKPWTAISGVMRSQVEPIVPGTYGYAFRKALERAAAADVETTN